MEQKQKGFQIGNYRITKTLGQGTFGKVKEGVHILTGQKVRQTTYTTNTEPLLTLANFWFVN